MEYVPGQRCTLIWWKCYLHSYATYHSFFMEEVLCDVKEGKSTMNGSCNASTVSTNTKGWYWDFEVWLNTKGITNLLLVPMLEAADSLVFTYTNGNWVVTSPKRKKVIFKRGTGVYNRKPYMDLMNKQE